MQMANGLEVHQSFDFYWLFSFLLIVNGDFTIYLHFDRL